MAAKGAEVSEVIGMRAPSYRMIVSTLTAILISLSVLLIAIWNDKLDSIDKDLSYLKGYLTSNDNDSTSIEITIVHTYSE